MKQVIAVLLMAATLLMTGCARHHDNEYEGRSYSRVKEVRTGEVIDHRYVIVGDEGGGSFIGALVGAVVGSTMGRGHGRTLMTIGGGVVGSVVGSEAGKANAEELTVALDDGGVIVVVVKGEGAYMVGDRVRIVLDGDIVETVTRVPNR